MPTWFSVPSPPVVHKFGSIIWDISFTVSRTLEKTGSKWGDEEVVVIGWHEWKKLLNELQCSPAYFFSHPHQTISCRSNSLADFLLRCMSAFGGGMVNKHESKHEQEWVTNIPSTGMEWIHALSIQAFLKVAPTWGTCAGTCRKQVLEQEEIGRCPDFGVQKTMSKTTIPVGQQGQKGGPKGLSRQQNGPKYVPWPGNAVCVAHAPARGPKCA